MVGVISFPPVLRENAYQRLLYDSLASEGFEVVGGGEFKVHWLARRRRQIRVLHFHWPQPYYLQLAAPRGVLSWIKLGLFGVRLAAARALGYRVIWTIHEVFPLDTTAPDMDRRGGRLLARFANVLVANDEATAEQARKELGSVADDVHVVPHSSYVGVYPEGRSRAEMREALGIAEDAFVFLLFGHVSVYKRVPWFVECFRAAAISGAVLVVAGLVMDEDDGDAIAAAAAEGDGIRALLEFIPDERVAELYGAADAAICPRQDGGTSGALMLAFSMGVAPIAAAVPAYEKLTDGDRGAWLFAPEDESSLQGAMRSAVADPAATQAKGRVGLTMVEELNWDGMGAKIGALLRAS